MLYAIPTTIIALFAVIIATTAIALCELVSWLMLIWAIPTFFAMQYLVIKLIEGLVEYERKKIHTLRSHKKLFRKSRG